MGPKRHLGQHFLTSPAYARKIAAAVPAQADEHVLEIGPGRGALSVFLKERFPDFHCIEIDRSITAALKEKLGTGTYAVHDGNVLDFDFGVAGFPLHVVGNLPYSIGALIIKKTLLYGAQIRSITFMLQREVVARIVSPPHRKSNGFLSIFCGFFGRPKVLFHVPAGAFFPRPNVDSSVMSMNVDAASVQLLPREKWDDFFAFVSKGFSMRRKKLANVIGGGPEGRARCEAILGNMGCEPFARPEDLGVKEWLGMYKQWSGQA